MDYGHSLVSNYHYNYPPVVSCSGNIITTSTSTSGYTWISYSGYNGYGSSTMSGIIYSPTSGVTYSPISFNPTRTITFQDAFTIEPDDEGNLTVKWDAKMDERQIYLSVDKINKLLKKFLDSERYEYTRRILKLALEEEIIKEVTKHFSI